MNRSSKDSQINQFINELASKLGRELGRDSSDILAERVINIAKYQKDATSFASACMAFGRFNRGFLEEIYNEIKSHSGDIIKPIGEFIKRTNNGLAQPHQQRIHKKIKLEYENEDNILSDDTEHKVIKQGNKIEFKKPSHTYSLAIAAKRERDNIEEGGDILSSTASERLRQIREQRASKIDKSTFKKEGSAHSSPIIKTFPSNRFNDDRIHQNNSKNQERSEYNSRHTNSNTDDRRHHHNHEDPREKDYSEYDAESMLTQERGWYLADEFGQVAGDDSHNPFGDESVYDTVREAQLEAKIAKRMSAKARENQRDNDLWERNRMLTSGTIQNGHVDLNFDDDREVREILTVHHLEPPFLDGRHILTKQKDPISSVRDPNSDMAVVSRKGSHLVKERRQQRERQKQARDASSIVGTTLGNVLNVKEESSNQPNSDSNGKFLKEISKLEQTEDELKEEAKSLKQQRQSLPAFAVRQELLNIIRDNQVTIIIGETGSGKTTQLTQFLYEEGYGKRGMIGCTQPRRVAAMSVAKRVSEEMEVKLGEEVGYAIRFEDVTSDKTIIKYMTDGILLRESLQQSDLEKYSCIIMDEAHERALNTDILLGLFKKILSRRRDLKLIVTSATMNADRFSRFYGGAPQFTIPGRTFPVDVLYTRSPIEDYVEAAIKQVLTIHLQSTTAGDILVFMTGQEDIEVTCEVLAERLAELNEPPPLEILPIYSQMPADLQAKIFEKPKHGVRKVIVATNIAETSLTVDGISYVVDTGYAKMKVYNPRMKMDTLQLVPISVANADQRSGRAGRTGPGTAYRMYTSRATKDEMYEQTIPEIQRTNLSNTLLLLKSLGVDNLLEFDFMDSPPEDTMTASLYDLWALGALTNLGKLTPLGSQMALFPMEPSLSKLLIMASENGCAEEMITIVAMLSVPNVFYRPKERQEESDQARERFLVPESDHLSLLNVYSIWKANGYRDYWCSKHFLHAKSLKRARDIRSQIHSIMTSQNLKTDSCGNNWDIIKKCICSGYFHQAAKVKGFGEYQNLRTSLSMHLHPTSALFGLGYLPDYVIYHELVLTSKEYMSTVTSVDPKWLAEYGGVFYSVKEKEFSGIDRKATEREYSSKMQLEAEIEGDRLRYEEEKKKEKSQLAKSKKKKSVVIGPGGKGSQFRNRRGF